MRLHVLDHRTGRSYELAGDERQVADAAWARWPWLRSRDPRHQAEELDQHLWMEARLEDDHAAPEPDRDPNGELDLDPVDRAADLLHGQAGQDAREALWDQDGDRVRAALVARGVEPTPDLVEQLGRVSVLGKSDTPPVECPKVARPLGPGTDELARQIQGRLEVGDCQPIDPKEGRHVAGSFLIGDGRGSGWICKLGTSGSPASGMERAGGSQAAREAAFAAALGVAGLGGSTPPVGLIELDGRPFAASRLLGDARSLDLVEQDRPGQARQLLAPYLASGLLHRWGAVDFILGNTDRHANNVLVTGDPSGDARVWLVDHGSSFAGPDFDPGHDRYTFVPAYLRAWGALDGPFNRLAQDEKLRKMPGAPDDAERALAAWLLELEQSRIPDVLRQYGIDPEPTRERLARLVSAVRAGRRADQAVLEAWVGLL